ncbi:hypothetical protein ASE01_12025 [Nocardioides sp. Root190]|uniref:phosphoribosyltransferase n=1 Tax=Nocardioides sp. Root190 TaxID=1736488 RepID=UPI0006FBAC76|nr:phosphoribosyltransferase [Nocardioides sp. Root190]KRB75786.1 hypothetical protein ASE01_12025 [Nocardioides sp. Root190]
MRAGAAPDTADLTATVETLLGVTVPVDDPDQPFTSLAGLALRDNPRRAHLIVSRILGKHIPVAPGDVLRGGALLGEAVRDAVDLRDPDGALVIGFCETATGLGHAVAQELGASYLHSTRRPVPGLPLRISFEEEHSHAVAHHLQPGLAFPLDGDGPLVLVDDELTTGRTALNMIAALHAQHPRDEYVVAALIDTRTAIEREGFERRAAEMGVRVRVASVLAVALDIPEDVLERVAAARSALPGPAAAPTGPLGSVHVHDEWWPQQRAATARSGMTREDTERLVGFAERLAGGLAGALEGSGSTLVVGTEELLHLPTLVGAGLAGRRPDLAVAFQSTTRSPVHAADDPGYAIRRSLAFPAPDDPSRPSRLHNIIDPSIVPPPGTPWSELRHEHIVVVVDAPAADCGPMVEALRPYAASVHVVVVDVERPFGSYPPEDVTWLLTDLSEVELERGTDDREEAIQSGVHYSEMLPVEFQPDASYLALFHEALAESARRLAVDTGVVGELLAARHEVHGERPVLVSLARAGTPVGVLLRRYYDQVHGWSVPHYTISIIRGRGIDEVALARVLESHPASAIAFVDGWTGKGAIQRQLTEAVAAWRESHPEHAALDDELAVLADPGGCTELHGTREDFLIPSACLNSTVSGLVSRTVLREDLIGPGMFHGAKFYPQWADEDVSRLFVDTVAAHFADAAADIAARVEDTTISRTVTWAGLRSLERIAATYSIADINLVKPGVGETTRVLLRRVPWQILVRPDRLGDLGHVLALAEARGVPVVPVADLPYSCIGLIRQVVP